MRGEVGLEFTARLLAGAAQARFDGLDKVAVSDGFRQVIIRSKVHAAAEIVFLAFGGEENEWDQGQPRILPQSSQHVVAVQLGHHHVAQD